MKSFNHLFGRVITEETRHEAVHNVLSKRRDEMRREIGYTDESMLEADAYDWIVNYKNEKHTPIEIYDGITRKKREIIVPKCKELVVQHCLMIALRPVFMKGMYEHSYASIPGRGAHKAKKHIEKWIRNDKKNCKYILKMDVRHFFNTIPHGILKKKLAKKIHDKAVLDLLFKIIDVTEVGLPLGFFTSQWLANWYLQGLDHHIKEDLKAAHYVRYMDDMVVFGSNKRKLHKMQEAIEKYLSDVLGLELKGNWQVYRFVYKETWEKDETTGKIKYRIKGRDLDFMGFRFYRNRTILRKTIMIKATRKARRMDKKEKPTIYDIRQMLSYMGWIGHTDTYKMYEKYVKPCVDIQKIKRRISAYDRRVNRERRIRMSGKIPMLQMQMAA